MFLSPFAQWHYGEPTELTNLGLFQFPVFQDIAALRPQLPTWALGNGSPLWMRFCVRNDTPDSLSLLVQYPISVRYSYLYRWRGKELQFLAKGGVHRNGYDATYPAKRICLPFMIKAGAVDTFCVRLLVNWPFSSKNFQLLSVQQERELRTQATLTNLRFYQYYAWVCGLLFFLGMVGLIRYLTFRDKSFLFYGISVACNGMYFFIRLNHFEGTAGFLGTYAAWIMHLQLFFLLMSYAAYYIFCIHFLSFQALSPSRFRFFRSIAIVIAAWAVLEAILFRVINQNLFVYNMIYGGLLVVMLPSFIGLIVVWQMRTRLSQLILLGLGVYYVCSIMGFLVSLDYLPLQQLGGMWKDEVFLTSLGALWEAIVIFIALGYKAKVVQEQKEEAERKYTLQLTETLRVQQAAYLEKEAIARDLHDEVASLLSSINILSATVPDASAHPRIQKRLDLIGERSRESITLMNDIVWNVDPKHETLEKMVGRLKNYAVEVLESRETALHFDISPTILALSLSMEQRRNFWLIAKEALHNVAKSAHASDVWVKMYQREQTLHVEVADNGVGFDLESAKRGNGLGNMHARAQSMGGRLAIFSELGVGTRLELNMPIP